MWPIIEVTASKIDILVYFYQSIFFEGEVITRLGYENKPKSVNIVVVFSSLLKFGIL